MKKPNNTTFTCVGINNAISILRSKRFTVTNIDLLKNGRAEREGQLASLLNSMPVNHCEKNVFSLKYSQGRAQGIAITFSGTVFENDIPGYADGKNVCLLVLDQVEDPQNFGQIIRTAECAGIDGIIIPKHHSASITESVLQVSQGAFVNMALYEVTNLRHEFEQLKKNDFWIVGLENSIDAKPWHMIQYTGKIVIVVGSEGRGIREKVLESCDFKATIPMQGKTNSLNVSAAVAAIAFERLRQLQEA